MTRDLLLIISCGVLLLILPVGWLIKVSIFLVACALIITFPMVRLAVSEYFGVKVSEQEVLLATKVNTWLTVPEIKERLEASRGRRVSLSGVMYGVYCMSKDGVLEGRERNPPQPAFFSEGNIWEYRRRM